MASGDEELGWLARLLTVLVKAMSDTFDAEYPTADFQDLWVSTEFPNEEQHYPGIWVDFEPTGELQTAGIGHTEYDVGADGFTHRLKRWTFSGYATFTIVAMTSLQRARLVDEVIKVMAFGDIDSVRGRFREAIQSNDYLGMNFDFDQVGITGKAETQGTPWGSDEIVYEITVRMDCVGEFVSDAETLALVHLSAVNVYPYTSDEPDPGSLSPLATDPALWR